MTLSGAKVKVAVGGLLHTLIGKAAENWEVDPKNTSEEVAVRFGPAGEPFQEKTPVDASAVTLASKKRPSSALSEKISTMLPGKATPDTPEVHEPLVIVGAGWL